MTKKVLYKMTKKVFYKMTKNVFIKCKKNFTFIFFNIYQKLEIKCEAKQENTIKIIENY